MMSPVFLGVFIVVPLFLPILWCYLCFYLFYNVTCVLICIYGVICVFSCFYGVAFIFKLCFYLCFKALPVFYGVTCGFVHFCFCCFSCVFKWLPVFLLMLCFFKGTCAWAWRGGDVGWYVPGMGRSSLLPCLLRHWMLNDGFRPDRLQQSSHWTFNSTPS